MTEVDKERYTNVARISRNGKYDIVITTESLIKLGCPRDIALDIAIDVYYEEPTVTL
jgi:hypothetical protein